MRWGGTIRGPLLNLLLIRRLLCVAPSGFSWCQHHPWLPGCTPKCLAAQALLQVYIGHCRRRLRPVHELRPQPPAPRDCHECCTGAAFSLFPLLGLQPSSGLRTALRAVPGPVALRVSSLSSDAASFFPACLATNLSLSPDGAQCPSRACRVPVPWSLVTCVRTFPTPSTQALTPASSAPWPPISIPSCEPGHSLLPCLRCLSACPHAQGLHQPASTPSPPVHPPLPLPGPSPKRRQVA